MARDRATLRRPDGVPRHAPRDLQVQRRRARGGVRRLSRRGGVGSSRAFPDGAALTPARRRPLGPVLRPRTHPRGAAIAVPDGTFASLGRPWHTPPRGGGLLPPCASRYGYATDTSPAALRSTRLIQYGGPRAGARVGVSVGSPRPRRNRRTDAASVTSATRRMRPPHVGQARTSIEKHLLRSSAQGRYREPTGLVDVSASGGSSAASGTAVVGTIFGRSLLAGASTPA